MIKLWNELGEIEATCSVTDDTLQGVVVVPHGLWCKHIRGGTVNKLVSHRPSEIGQGITVNDTKVKICLNFKSVNGSN